MSRTGHGKALGAVTIVNATATGVGCALAVAGGATATWMPTPESGVRLADGTDTRLARAVFAQMPEAGEGGVRMRIECAFPPSRGLKTSSSVAAALLRAGADSVGKALPDAEVEARAVAAARRAGVTLTGAYDDQVATVRGGCHLTDNRAQRILADVPVKPWAVAVWVPLQLLPKQRLRGVDVSGAAVGAAKAADLVRQGRLAEAMTENGRAFHAAYAHAGLPVDDRPTQVALAHGALGAGLSGTGPAVAALFDSAQELPPVAGGAWHWTKAVPTG